ncbi:MAG: uroporphyrinogen-III C-methyltransferase [Planctomycetota bacterium]
MNPRYPIFLQLTERPVLLIGGGRVAERRIPRLLESGARVTVVSPEVRPAIEKLARSGTIEWRKRGFEPGDLDGAFLALLAVGDPELLAVVVEESRERGVLLNTAEDATTCDFHVPAVSGHEEARVAISTGGESPELSKSLRRRLDRWLEVQVKHARREAMGVRVALVGAGPGDPGLLTVRGQEWLDRADVVYYDRLVPEELLKTLSPEPELVYVGKEVGCATRANITELMIESARRGQTVVRLKGGDPILFGRGGEEMRALRAAGIDFELVPGVSALCSAPGSAGIPVTYRRLASELIVRSGHPLTDLDEGAANRWRETTFVYFMAVGRLSLVVRELLRDGVPATTPVAIVHKGTQDGERVLDGRLDTIVDLVKEAHIEAPSLVVVGDVVRFRDPADFDRLLEERDATETPPAQDLSTNSP